MMEPGILRCRVCHGRWEEFHPGGACPHCGTEAARDFVTDVIEPESGGIHTDVACITCAYNLRMQTVHGRCPECGTPIADSLVRGRLDFMPIAWLRRVALGIRGTFVALLIAAVGLLLSFAIQFAWIFPGGFGVSMVVGLAISLAYIVLTPVIWIFGAWRATTPDVLNAPDWRHLRRRITWTRGLMLVSVAMLLFLILVMLLSLFGNNPSSEVPFTIMSCMAFGVPFTLLSSVLLYATILRSYMARQNQVWLPRMLRAWVWVIGAGIVFFMAVILLEWTPISMGYDVYDLWSYWYEEIREFVVTVSWVLQVASLGVGLYCTFGAWRHFRAIIRRNDSLTGR